MFSSSIGVINFFEFRFYIIFYLLIYVYWKYKNIENIVEKNGRGNICKEVGGRVLDLNTNKRLVLG